MRWKVTSMGVTGVCFGRAGSGIPEVRLLYGSYVIRGMALGFVLEYIYTCQLSPANDLDLNPWYHTNGEFEAARADPVPASRASFLPACQLALSAPCETYTQSHAAARIRG